MCFPPKMKNMFSRQKQKMCFPAKNAFSRQIAKHVFSLNSQNQISAQTEKFYFLPKLFLYFRQLRKINYEKKIKKSINQNKDILVICLLNSLRWK